MALSDKTIVITPRTSVGSPLNADPNIRFTAAGGSPDVPLTIDLFARPINGGTLSFEGSAGQLFSISNDLTGTIFSVNDVSGIPSIEVDADGSIRLGEFGGYVTIGGALPGSVSFGSPATFTVSADLKLMANNSLASFATFRMGANTLEIFGSPGGMNWIQTYGVDYIVRKGGRFVAYETADINFVEMYHDGTDGRISADGTSGLTFVADYSSFSSQIRAAASTTSAASLNIPEGTAPSAPNDGDIWVTTTDIFARINGVSESLLGGGGLSGTVANDQVVTGTGASTVDSSANLTFNGTTLALTGSMTVTGTVDGKDVSTLIANVVEDTSPQLGADLDMQSFGLTGALQGTGGITDATIYLTGQGTAISMGTYANLGRTYSVASTVLSNNAYVDSTDVVAGQMRYATTHASYGHTIYEMYQGDHFWYGESASVTGDAIISKKLQMNLSDTNVLTLYDTGVTDSVAFSHDGTDFNILGTNTTAINIQPTSGTNALEISTAVNLYNSGTLTASTNAERWDIYANDSISTSSCSLYFRLANGTNRGWMGYSGGDTFAWFSLTNGAAMAISATDAGGVTRTILSADPDSTTELRADTNLSLTVNAGTNALVATGGGAVTLYHAGTSVIQTQTYNGTDNITGAEIKHFDNTFYDIGLAVMPQVTATGAVTVSDTHQHKTILITSGTGAISFVSDTTMAVGSVGWVINNSGSSNAITATTNVFWADGAGGQTGSRTLADGGWLTWWKQADTQYYITGVGIS